MKEFAARWDEDYVSVQIRLGRMKESSAESCRSRLEAAHRSVLRADAARRDLAAARARVHEGLAGQGALAQDRPQRDGGVQGDVQARGAGVPRFQVPMRRKTPPPIASDTQPPCSILMMLAPKNARSITRNAPASAPARSPDQCQRWRAMT